MELKTKENLQAIRQLPKLKSLLKKYRQVKTMQSGLLQLSELASAVTDMNAFYNALADVVKSLLITDSFHIALTNSKQELELAYCHNPVEQHLLERVHVTNWHQSMTGIVYESEEPMHCCSAARMALAKTGKIVLYGSQCVDWLGVPLRRGNQVIGVIAIQSYDEKLYFDDRDCQLLEFIAEHLVTAIDRVRSREILEQNILARTKKLTETNQKLQREIAERQKVVKMHQAMLNISELTASSTNLEDFYKTLHKEVATIIPAKNFYIGLIENEEMELSFPYFYDEKVTANDAPKIVSGLSELAIRVELPMLISNGSIWLLQEDKSVSEKPFTLKFPDTKLPQAWLGATLIDHGRIIGVLAIQHYQDADAYQQSDLEIIRFVSQHIATAINRKAAQDRITLHNEELERKVDQRTRELQASNLNLRMQIEERRKAEAQLYYEAHHDALTKLPNRAMFLDRLAFSLRRLKRHPDNRFAVLFIDLDRFKMINDTLGHHAGDQFLVEIAHRLTECVRDNDILARLGGDEFVVLLDALQSQEDVEEVASRIIAKIGQPFDLEGNIVYSNASIGIAQCSSRYHDASEILRDADAAMYQAKSLGRGRYVFFDESMREQLIASMTLEQELRVAIKENQFELHYQKITDLTLTTSIGYEALLRWKHPSKGILTPSEFLFMAEETGMILDIEIWVVEEVCRQLKTWEKCPENKNAYIGINLSGRHLTQVNQLTELIALIEQNTVEPQRLILEFNESAFTQQPDVALKGLKRLKQFGVKLALDDYGAGQSSFNLLHSYPFEFIKLDRSFIRSINSNEENISLVKALHELGDKFGYRLVAEGIETEEMLEKLKEVGCDYGQGYHISRPGRLIDNVLRFVKPKASA
jgi:diguanylate cyclase (GGDEF)-like protein